MRDTGVTPQDRALLEELYIRAKESVESCRQEAEAARQRHAQAVERLAHLQALLDLDRPPERANQQGVKPATDANGGLDRQAVDIAAQVLAERNTAMHYRDIYEEIQRRGILIRGANPANTLLTRMLRDGRFKPAAQRGSYVLDTHAEHKHFRSDGRRSR